MEQCMITIRIDGPDAMMLADKFLKKWDNKGDQDYMSFGERAIFEFEEVSSDKYSVMLTGWTKNNFNEADMKKINKDFCFLGALFTATLRIEMFVPAGNQLEEFKIEKGVLSVKYVDSDSEVWESDEEDRDDTVYELLDAAEYEIIDTLFKKESDYTISNNLLDPLYEDALYNHGEVMDGDAVDVYCEVLKERLNDLMGNV